MSLTDLVGTALDAVGLAGIGHAFLLDLRTGRCGSARAGADVYPASIVKVPIMTEAFRRFAEGSLAPDDRVTVSAANQTESWGGSPFAAGTKTTIGHLLERMITHSDNVATNQLIDLLRREQVTTAMRRLGLATFLLGRKLSGSDPLIDDPEMVGRNRLPPEEIGALLARIARDEVPGAAQQRDILRRCVDDGKLARGLREGDAFMHKTGETSQTSHDAGILQTRDGGAYVVVLYTQRPEDDGRGADVDRQMADWMSGVREHL